MDSMTFQVQENHIALQMAAVGSILAENNRDSSDRGSFLSSCFGELKDICRRLPKPLEGTNSHRACERMLWEIGYL